MEAEAGGVGLGLPIASSSSSSGAQIERARRAHQRADALKRQERNHLLDKAAAATGIHYAWQHDLPDYEDDEILHESRILLEEIEKHNLRQRGRALVANDLQARGSQFLELRPTEGNPFGDITRILLEAAASYHVKRKRSPSPEARLPVQRPAPAPASRTPSLPAHTVAPPPAAVPAAISNALAPMVGSNGRDRSGSIIAVAPVQRKNKDTIILPQMIDGFRLYSLGRLGNQPQFYEKGVIFAPGYRVMRPFLSTSAGASNVVQHTCEIIHRDNGPVFKITADDTKQTYESFSIIEAWLAVGRPAFQLRGYHCNESAEAALDFFGLSVPRIRKLLEELPPPAGLALETMGVQPHQWLETTRVADDTEFALRTVETSLVRLNASQAIETVVRPPISPTSHEIPAQFPPPVPTNRRGSYASDGLSPASINGRRYSATADDLARAYPPSYGSPVPGAGMLTLGHNSSSPQMSRFSSSTSTAPTMAAPGAPNGLLPARAGSISNEASPSIGATEAHATDPRSLPPKSSVQPSAAQAAL